MGRFLTGLTREELAILCARLGERPFRARQLFEQVHGRGTGRFDDMKVLPARLRQALEEEGWACRSLETADRRESEDGTVKLALKTHDGHLIETVLIPMDGTFTQCLSSQIGCALGCRICMTATLGFLRNLEPAEIVDQCLVAADLFPDRPVRNLVFMGMGEPLLNFDHLATAVSLLQDPKGRAFPARRITVSTAGIVPGIKRLGEEVDCLLAVSLNAPDQKLREDLMSIAGRYPLDRLMASLKAFPLPPRRKITIEYVLVGGQNDGVEHAGLLVRLLSHIKCKVNLIPFNPFPGCELEVPTPERVDAFLKTLEAKHVTATIRRSKGADIQAACGQLAGRRAKVPRTERD